MQKKYAALIVLATVILAGVSVMEYTQGTVSAVTFDQMKYSYSSHVSIPSTTANKSNLGGYYSINGTGRDFKMLVVLPGAEKAESPLDYTADGLHIAGKIDTIKVTPDTITALLQNNVKTAMFNTVFNGTMDMNCAVWSGTSYFRNDGKNFTGTFLITGVYTDWEGNYSLNQDVKGIKLVTDFIIYDHGNKTPKNTKNAHSVYYL